jgi:hypothetical protein
MQNGINNILRMHMVDMPKSCTQSCINTKRDKGSELERKESLNG